MNENKNDNKIKNNEIILTLEINNEDANTIIYFLDNSAFHD